MKFLPINLLLLLAAFVLSSCSSISYSNRGAENAASVEVLRAVNRERAQRGLVQLRPDAGLKALAGTHTSYLRSTVDPRRGKPTNAMAHANFGSRAKKGEAAGYRVVSEVVMIGYAGDLSAVAQRTVKGWLSSPGHRAAILNPDRRVMGVETSLPADQRYFVVGILSNGRGR